MVRVLVFVPCFVIAVVAAIVLVEKEDMVSVTLVVPGCLLSLYWAERALQFRTGTGIRPTADADSGCTTGCKRLVCSLLFFLVLWLGLVLTASFNSMWCVTRSWHRQELLHLASEVFATMNRANIPIMLDQGSLLGAVRNGASIPWEHDFDMGIKESDAYSPRVAAILKQSNWNLDALWLNRRLHTMGFRVYLPSRWYVWHWLNKHGPKLWIDVYKLRYTSWPHGATHLFKPKNEVLDSLVPILLDGQTFLVPTTNVTDEYLTFLYGPSYMAPQHHYEERSTCLLWRDIY